MIDEMVMSGWYLAMTACKILLPLAIPAVVMSMVVGMIITTTMLYTTDKQQTTERGDNDTKRIERKV